MNKALASLAAKHPDKVSGFYRDPDGWWLELKSGWQAESHSEVHVVHADTAREIVEDFSSVVPCACVDCRRALLAGI